MQYKNLYLETFMPVAHTEGEGRLRDYTPNQKYLKVVFYIVLSYSDTRTIFFFWKKGSKELSKITKNILRIIY